jgi:hypothetical protein
MKTLTGSYLVPFNPNDTGEAFGLLRATIAGRDQWWLAQVWAADDADETVMLRFLDIDGPDGDFTDQATRYRGQPWFAMSWISDDIPRRQVPALRVQLDFPGGQRVTREWDAGALSDATPRTVIDAIGRAIKVPVHA